MKPRYLLPNRYKKIGIPISVIFLLLGIAGIYLDYHPGFLTINLAPFYSKDLLFGGDVNLADTLAGIGLIVGLMFIAFSKEKYEDEYIGRLRLESLQWAVYINYGLLLISFILIYGSPFLSVMIYNMFTVLIIYIIRFNFILYRQKRQLVHEK